MADPGPAFGVQSWAGMEMVLGTFVLLMGAKAAVKAEKAGSSTVVFSIKPKTREDAAKLIGSGGRVAKALRVIVESAGRAQGKTFELDVTSGGR